ncbi:MAG: DUF4476 domain-containing protein [Chitinophagaceae bacterium]|jgi:hypothetical protein
MLRIKHFFLLTLILFSGSAHAQWTPTANLTVFSENGSKFYLILNGERYNDIPQTNIRIEELPNPYYNCRIIFEDKSIPEISKNALMLTDANGIMQDVTYRIKKDNKSRNVLRFYSFVPAQQNMARPSNCATYRFGSPNRMLNNSNGSYTETTTIQQSSIEPITINMNVGGANVDMSLPANTGINTTTITSSSGNNIRRDNYDNDNRQYPNRGNNNSNNRNNKRGCNVSMNSGDFNEAKATVANNSFDETKLSTAKQIISSNCVSTNQIIALLSTFSFEESKLDFAKYAYEFCMDRNNYFKVSNAFTFESSKTELNAYVQSMR